MEKFDLDGDGKIDEAEMLAGVAALMAPASRERLCNDILNTAVIAALVGGFALGSLSAPEGAPIDRWIYFCAYCAVHARGRVWDPPRRFLETLPRGFGLVPSAFL